VSGRAEISATSSALTPFVSAISAGLIATLVVVFVMDPLALVTTGVTFAAADIYAFVARSMIGSPVSNQVGALVHWASFAVGLPMLWWFLARKARPMTGFILGVAVCSGAWLALMTVVFPLGGLPIFYNFSLTTIWSGAAFAVLGAALGISGLLSLGRS